MDEIRLRQEGAPEGLTVVADRQTAGQGRAGRVWLDAPSSSLLFSTLLRPECSPERFTLFPIVAGLAVVKAVKVLYGLQSRAKWPNDVLVNDRKVAGILVTSRVQGDVIDFATVGIGVNLAHTPNQVAGRAVAIAELTSTPINRDVLLEAILRELEEVYSYLLQGDIEPLLAEWQKSAAWIGERVTVLVQETVVDGVLEGIAPSGALRLVTVDGQLVEVTSGDMTRGPRPSDSLRGS